MKEPIIEVRNLSKEYRLGATAGYGRLTESIMDTVIHPVRAIKSSMSPKPSFFALRDVSFEVREGEVLGVIGRNGAGKSTLLKTLSRITYPSSGEILLRGRIGSLLEVGTGFHPELTGRENIYLNGAILGMKKREIDAKFDDIVRFSEVEKFLDTPVKRYSSGMYMRLAFAVAAHLDPEILLVDEVLAVGDATFQKKCLKKMKDVSEEGRTVLFVSHNMNAVEQLCTSALLLEKGTLKRRSDDVRSVIKDYLFSAGDDSKPAEWVNGGNEFQNPWFTPVRMYMADDAGNRLSMPAGNTEPMWVHLEVEMAQLDPAFTLGYAIFNEDGYLLYWSYHTDLEEGRWPRLRNGRCVLRSRIPARFLNEGTYRIEMIASLHFRQWLLEPGVKAPSINLTIQGGLSDSPLWIMKRPGALAPTMEWQLMDGAKN